MGGGTYNSDTRAIRSTTRGYATKRVEEIFSGSLHESMNPKGVTLRESRDHDDHPNSFPIIIGLDVTASMGRIPHNLIKTGLPHIMQKIIDSGFPDPQVLFIAIGDHISDSSPLQIGQFESNDESLDMWLERTYLEGGGGGNGGESYALAWFFASQFTKHDSFEKRGNKGLLITIGDEMNHQMLHNTAINSIMGTSIEKSFNASELLTKTQETYKVYHINMDKGSGWNGDVKGHWDKHMPENVIHESDDSKIADVIANLVIDSVKLNSIIDFHGESAPAPDSVDETQEML